MSNITGAFQANFTLTPSFEGTRDTTSSFQMDVTFGGRFDANTNALTLTVDTPGSLTFTPDTPGSLGS